MNTYMIKLERIINLIIPPLLIILLLVIIGEIVFKEWMHNHSIYIDIFDGMIIIIFAIDLAFKYNRIKKFKKFLKKYWLEILAIFPFFLIFRIYDQLAYLLGSLKELIIPSQKILHEGLAVENIVARESRVAELLRPVTRTPRFLTLNETKRRKQFLEDLKKLEKEGIKIPKDGIKLTKEGFFVTKTISKKLEKEGIIVMKDGIRFIKKDSKKLSTRLKTAYKFYKKLK
ncbi:MAG TPA: hypothetical protein VJB89_00155 [Candidatus Nanoarchaeia archaeon]|nr:hypothetical protein [Candidatus Nanoarchaeia archaeon]